MSQLVANSEPLSFVALPRRILDEGCVATVNSICKVSATGSTNLAE